MASEREYIGLQVDCAVSSQMEFEPGYWWSNVNADV
jgi:hypothetical protein